jgi:hypothetical protein
LVARKRWGLNLESIVIGAFIIALVLAVYGGYYFYLYPKLANRFEYIALNKFKGFLSQLKSPYDTYSYFTDSHLIWSETNIPEILQLIHKHCRKHAPEVGVAAGPARFLLYVDELKKRVYIVFTEAKSFDWENFPHYDEYISGKKNSILQGSASDAQ